MLVYLLREVRQHVCVHVRLIYHRLSPDRPFRSSAGATGPWFHSLRERKTSQNIITTISINTTFIYKKYSRTNKSVTNHSIRLLCIQVLFVHLVEFIKHCGHHRQVPFISSCKHWGKRHWFIKHYPNIYFKHHILLYQACLLCEHTDKMTILQSRLRNRKSMSLPLSCRRFGVGWSFTWRYHKYPDKQRTYNHSPLRQIGFHLCIV